MTLGSAAKAHLVLIAWCKDCRHQAAPDLAEMASDTAPTCRCSIGANGWSARNAAASMSTAS